MTPEEQNVLQRLAPLVAIYPNFKPSPETFDVYARVLADLDPLMLEAAIFELISQDREFMPKPGAIRQAAVDLELRAQGVKMPYEAWTWVLSEIRRVGHSGQPNLDPPSEQAVAAIGGWRNVCLSENPVADRARFIDAYREFRGREIENRRMLPAVLAYVAEIADKMSIDKQLTGGSDG